MKKLVLAGFLLAGILGANAQNVSQTSTLTSGGNLAGTIGSKGTYYGAKAGKSMLANSVPVEISDNVFIGSNAGGSVTTGKFNTFTGANTGSPVQDPLTAPNIPFLVSGAYNSFYGSASGNENNGGNNNSFFGSNSGSSNVNGSNNTYLGFNSASNNKGSNNICVGSSSGPVSPNKLGAFVSNQLFIDNTRSNEPLIWGDFAADQLKLNGKVGVGAVTTFPTNSLYSNYKLFVTGGILTDEVRVALSASGTWADYVFANDYNLRPLSEVEAFIAKNKHLPNVPSAKQVKEEGINVGDMARIQQEKIEELTLYIIAQNKRIEALEAKMNNK